ncbi:MAG: zinc ABC transporter substrate-binding protein [Chloroflexi bacterium]|nr:zinc ABC transporter substrate-binding protein [Chloroflexota bacterium]
MSIFESVKPLFAAALLLLSAACSAAPASLPTARLRVVVTFSVLGDFVGRVAGGMADINVLVPAGGDAHEYEPAPSDVVRIADADVIVENGVGFEAWLDMLYQSSGSKATRIIASEGIKLREVAEGRTVHDPHIWHDVRNAIRMVNNIAEAFARADAPNAVQYQANAAKYVAELDALDAEIAAKIGTLSESQRRIVTTHDSLGYFGARYGVEMIGSVIDSVSTESGEPSAQEMAALIEKIHTQHVQAIFVENMSNPRLVERVAQEAGVRVGGELFTDALGAPGSVYATYIDAMRANVRTLSEAVK